MRRWGNIHVAAQGWEMQFCTGERGKLQKMCAMGKKCSEWRDKRRRVCLGGEETVQGLRVKKTLLDLIESFFISVLLLPPSLCPSPFLVLLETTR